MDSIRAKRVMIAAPKSGSGKTLITCALLEALKNKGLAPVSFKCGPDYIDPMFHKKVLGVDSRNLDTYFAGCEGVKSIISGCGDRYAVIEGVMGIYDGISADGIKGSCYEIAETSKTPVILAVDASKAGRTVISMIKGILLDDSAHLIKGIILNRISGAFYESLSPILRKELMDMREDISLLGFFPESKDTGIKGRHLGLMLPGEIDDIKGRIDLAASYLEKNIDLNAVISIMENAPVTEPEGETPEKSLISECGEGLTLAVAYDDAFCFYYRDNLEIFRKCGVKIRYFSPLKDACLPSDADGMLIGGGYPENFLPELSRNTSMLDSIKKAIDGGLPSLAECGGFMYLHKTVKDIEGKRYEMTGVIDGECAYTGHTVRFGYMYIDKVNKPYADDVLYGSLKGIRGHEFHYYDSSFNGEACLAKKPNRDGKWECMFMKNNGIWGFPHFYYGSSPEFIRCFIESMKAQAATSCQSI